MILKHWKERLRMEKDDKLRATIALQSIALALDSQTFEKIRPMTEAIAEILDKEPTDE